MDVEELKKLMQEEDEIAELKQKEDKEISKRKGKTIDFSDKVKQSDRCYASSCTEKNLHSFNSKNCKLCGELVCDKHVMPENHDCVKHIYVKYLRKNWLRKYGLNVSTGRYRVSCDKCRYRSEFLVIEDAGEKREFHIKNGCDGSKVWIEGME